MPDTAAAWRKQYGLQAWLFNPWTGQAREQRDIEQDADGKMILPPGEMPSFDWSLRILKLMRAEGAMGQLMLAGWLCKLDAQKLTMNLRKGSEDVTFDLMDTNAEERYYLLVRLEAMKRFLE